MVGGQIFVTTAKYSLISPDVWLKEELYIVAFICVLVISLCTAIMTERTSCDIGRKFVTFSISIACCVLVTMFMLLGKEPTIISLILWIGIIEESVVCGIDVATQWKSV